jgi:hypothetical protein
MRINCYRWISMRQNIKIKPNLLTSDPPFMRHGAWWQVGFWGASFTPGPCAEAFLGGQAFGEVLSDSVVAASGEALPGAPINSCPSFTAGIPFLFVFRLCTLGNPANQANQANQANPSSYPLPPGPRIAEYGGSIFGSIWRHIPRVAPVAKQIQPATAG